MAPGSQSKLLKSLKNSAGISAVTTADNIDASLNAETLEGEEAVLLDSLGVLLMTGDDMDKLEALNAAVADDTNPVMAVEEEQYVFAIGDDGYLTEAGRDYVRGYRDGVNNWAAKLLGGGQDGHGGGIEASETFADTALLTWGLQATRVNQSGANGAGIRVAVLDTGMVVNPLHPDFAGRQMLSASFVGEPVQDLHGHGTHCIGTALGRQQLAGGTRRYGVAGQSVILAGKVLNNAGRGADGGILAGINWALQNGARVISMSLGSPVAAGAPPSAAYENAGRSALNAGSLIIAAAGNENGAPVGRPANSPSIMAVAAVDQSLRRASFSNRGINGNGGEVNIAGPGVGVFSSFRMPARYASINGTSMATPHVAGIAALWSQRTGARGMALWQRLVTSARPLGQPARDVGAGLVQAPVP